MNGGLNPGRLDEKDSCKSRSWRSNGVYEVGRFSESRDVQRTVEAENEMVVVSFWWSGAKAEGMSGCNLRCAATTSVSVLGVD